MGHKGVPDALRGLALRAPGADALALMAAAQLVDEMLEQNARFGGAINDMLARLNELGRSDDVLRLVHHTACSGCAESANQRAEAKAREQLARGNGVALNIGGTTVVATPKAGAPQPAAADPPAYPCPGPRGSSS